MVCTASLMHEQLEDVHQAVRPCTNRHTASTSHCSKETCGLKSHRKKEMTRNWEESGTNTQQELHVPIWSLFVSSEVTLSHRPQVVLCWLCPSKANTSPSRLACVGLSRSQPRAARKSGQTSGERGDRSQEAVTAMVRAHCRISEDASS